MLRSALVRLTLSYLTIIMALSIGFSFALYNISLHELDRELRRPSPVEQIQPEYFLNFGIFRKSRFNESIRSLRWNIFLLNLGMLAIGSSASYLLAKRTLRPIEEAMETQARFTGDASHELRTPLTAMQTEIEVALRDKKLSRQDSVKLLESNLEEVIKLRSLSDNLLKLARQDKQDLEFKAVSLAKITQKAIDQLKPLADAKKVILEAGPQTVKVLGDTDSLQELAIILIDNAIKYSPSGRSVKVSAEIKGNTARWIFKDNGYGIRGTDLSHIFERFYRVDSSRSRATAGGSPGGYGLGLSIAKQIVDLHKGSIEVHSQLGKGSTFTVVLPAAKSS